MIEMRNVRDFTRYCVVFVKSLHAHPIVTVPRLVLSLLLLLLLILSNIIILEPDRYVLHILKHLLRNRHVQLNETTS